jgi:hypothetical protein
VNGSLYDDPATGLSDILRTDLTVSPVLTEQIVGRAGHTIVASRGGSVLAFKQSGIVERRDVTEDLMLYTMIKIRVCCTTLTKQIVEGPTLSIWPALRRAE